jgi:hypothetical protein
MSSKNTAKIFIILLLLSSCGVNNCKVGYDISVEERQSSDNSTAESDQDPKQKKKIIDMAKDLKDNVKPGAQVSCSY